MAKKRKGSSRTAQEDDGPSTDVGESRKRIKTYEDVADSDDEFHMNRDKVLLDEGPDAKRRRKRQEQEEFLEPSDEEVLAYAEPDDRDEDEDLDARDIPATGSEASGDGAEEEELSGWGTSRDALYGADAIETEQDALDEEAEALRLQKKQLQSMSAADYGFDESEWQDATTGEEKDRDGAVVTEVLPQLQIADDMGPAERLKLLKSRYPEFEPLSKEFLELQELQVRLADDAKASGEVFKAAGMSYTPISLTKYRSATAYLGTLTMYFALLTSTTSDGIAMSATKLRDHPVMDSLVKCRELWMKVRSLPTEDLEAIVEDQAPVLNGDTYETKLDIAGALETAHLERQPKKSRAQRHAEAAEAAAEARRAEKLQRTEADLADLDALIQPNVGKKSSKIDKSQPVILANGGDSDIGEEAELDSHEAAEKAKRKKSLRFYTSQITQKVNKRGAAGRNAGGDDDIPHRERLRDRQARLNAEAEKRGKKRDEDRDELGGESDEEDRRQARELRNEAGEDDYYDLVAARTAKKKADKQSLAEAQKQAALQGGQVVQEAVVGPDGKRAITYAIEKNKGLTPHRKKDVRNPRVKKRKKYDEKKKKLASIKPVYKGGEGRGGYGGELTGIKKGLVKSTKL